MSDKSTNSEVETSGSTKKKEKSPGVIKPGSESQPQTDSVSVKDVTTSPSSDQTTSGHPHPLLPDSDDVVALEVRALPVGGFWRCGRFWSNEPVHVFASDDPDGDNAANNAHLGVQADCFISRDDMARLQAEPMLIVDILDTVQEQA